jgi:hypothetical protein
VIGIAEWIGRRAVGDLVGAGEVFVRQVPAVLDVDDADVGAGAAGNRCRIESLDAAWRGVAIALRPTEVRCHGWGGRLGLAVGRLDHLKGAEIGDQAIGVGPRPQFQAVPQIQIGPGATRTRRPPATVGVEAGFRTREEPLDRRPGILRGAPT